MEKLISVIIPVYNGANYIERVVKSIMDSNNDNYFELIVVNDGSTDNTCEILNELQKKYININVINKKNTGVSGSRNCGIKASKGNWLVFCDADDEYEPGLINKVYKDISSYDNLSVVVYGRTDFYCNKKIVCNDHKDIKLYSDSDNYVYDRLCSGKISFSVCNKAYKKGIINKYNICFDDNLRLSEDLDFNLQYFNYCNKILEDFTCSYYRYCNNGSTLYKKNSDFFVENINIIDSLNSKYKNVYDENIFNRLYSHFIIISLNRLFTGIDENTGSYSIFKDECKKIYSYYSKNNISLYYKKNKRNLILFGLFKLKMFYVLYIVSVKIGNIFRKLR